MKIILKEVTVETVTKGKNRYQIANVSYTYNGETRGQKIFSFSNPTVFKEIQEVAPGSTVEVDLAKDDRGYTQWAKITVGEKAAASAPAGTNRVVGSNYETREERAARQVLIVRQSCLAQAVATLAINPDGRPVPAEYVTELADTYVDWVMNGNQEDLDKAHTDNGVSEA